jgi:hypothetical protein
MTSSGESAPTRAPRWRELGPLAKLARVATAVFVATFLTLGLAKALPQEHWLKDRVAPLEQKTAPLRLNSRWRMFVGEARFGFILLETELPSPTGEGERYQLESFRWEGKSWLERARDIRLRKMQAKLKDKGQRRRWGKHYLSYVCRSYGQELPEMSTIEVILGKPLILDDKGKRRSRPSREVIAKFDCATGRFTEGG